MITLIDKYGFIRQLNMVLPPHMTTYKMACYPKDHLAWREPLSVYAPNIETRTFYRQGNTNVFEER
jgi:hypothetical protein